MLHFTQCLTDEHDNCPEEVEISFEDPNGSRLVKCPCRCHKDPYFDR